MHEGDHVNAVRYCFNLGSFLCIVVCACVMFVRRDDEKNKKQITRRKKTHKKIQKTNTFQVQSAKCAHP